MSGPPRLTLGASPLHGQGLCATGDIKRGQFVRSLTLTNLQVHHLMQNTDKVPVWPFDGPLTHINHRCTPNVEISLILNNTQTVNVYAIRTIKSGEELTAGYCDVLQRRELRWRELGFKCLCDTCKLEGSAFNTSEGRRARLDAAVRELQTFRDHHYPDLLNDDPMTLASHTLQAIQHYDRLGSVRTAAPMAVDFADKENLCVRDLAIAFDTHAVLEMVAGRDKQCNQWRIKMLLWLTCNLGDAHPCTISCKNAIRVQIGAVGGRAAVAPAPQSLPTAPKTTKTCYIVDSSTYGNGFFAAREITQGELIISEQVKVSLPGMDLDNEPTFLEALRSLDDAVKMLLLEMIARIADPDKVSYSMPLKTIDDFNRALAEDAVGFAPYMLSVTQRMCFPFTAGHMVYHVISRGWRVNHSCNPTAEASFDPVTGCVNIRALVNIQENHQITISYVSMYDTRAARHAALGFECNCEICIAAPFDEAGDDYRRQLGGSLRKIRAYRDQLPSEVFGVDAEAAASLGRDSETQAVAKLIMDMDVIGKSTDITMTSELSVWSEVQSFLARIVSFWPGLSKQIQVSWQKKSEECKHLAQCLGAGHLRTQTSYRGCLEMLNDQKLQGFAASEVVAKFKAEMARLAALDWT
ncbi:hypothetical protein LTR22_013813 [Elasticomyces elasticus]|nr:hypothetical protein LTR22_013813 [Elasticomyces elasticus]KAK4917662.1 hypothetical protein LTR49_014484 [Elasticomyces elasticus]KAK5752049.1 hypothetical protein LTS12_017899 [Elasticomyces elasticus]